MITLKKTITSFFLNSFAYLLLASQLFSAIKIDTTLFNAKQKAFNTIVNILTESPKARDYLRNYIHALLKFMKSQNEAAVITPINQSLKSIPEFCNDYIQASIITDLELVDLKKELLILEKSENSQLFEEKENFYLNLLQEKFILLTREKRFNLEKNATIAALELLKLIIDNINIITKDDDYCFIFKHNKNLSLIKATLADESVCLFCEKPGNERFFFSGNSDLLKHEACQLEYEKLTDTLYREKVESWIQRFTDQSHEEPSELDLLAIQKASSGAINNSLIKFAESIGELSIKSFIENNGLKLSQEKLKDILIEKKLEIEESIEKLSIEEPAAQQAIKELSIQEPQQ